MTTTTNTLAALRSAAIVVGEPDVVDGLAVFPLLGEESRLAFLSFAEAAAAGATVQELRGGASVNDLLVRNPLDVPVLLFEGEEVLGAQQNRTFDVTVLVAARSELQVPVSCVEHGRWDGTRSGEAFKPSPQTADPELRRRKNAMARAAAAHGGEARADQSAVWSYIDEKADALGAHAPTRAMHDVFGAREDLLAKAATGVNRRPGQLGAIAVAGGKPIVCDWVGRAEAFAALHGPLVRGYALDAVAEPASEVPGVEELQGWVTSALRAHASVRPTPGIGESLHFVNAIIEGTALAHDGELVQLCAFPGERREARAIRRPSRRV